MLLTAKQTICLLFPEVKWLFEPGSLGVSICSPVGFFYVFSFLVNKHDYQNICFIDFDEDLRAHVL